MYEKENEMDCDGDEPDDAVRVGWVLWKPTTGRNRGREGENRGRG